jgi:PilZ domain-containing protein
MQERRKQPRKDLMSYSQVYDLHDGKLIGYLGDLNLFGAMVISDHPMDEDLGLMISIELPELPRINDVNLTISARIAWCHQDISPDYFNVGLEFSSTTEKQQYIIQAVMDNYEFRRQAPNYPTHPSEIEEDQ